MKRKAVIAAAWAIVGLVLVPVVGMILAWVDPPPGFGLPKPRGLGELMPLVGRTLALAVLVSSVALVLGTWLAWVELRVKAPFVRFLSVLTVLPLVVPSYLMATILREAMAPRGVLGEVLGTEGRFTGFWPAALVLIISTTPYVQILVGAALRRLPAAQEEAARSLGATPWRRFRTLIAPHLRPTWAFSVVIVALYCTSEFGSVAVLDCKVLTWELYRAYSNFDVPNAVRLGFGLMLLVVPLLIGVRLLHGKARVERGASQDRSAEPRPVAAPVLGLTWCLQLAIVGLGVALPLFSLGSWVIAGMAQPTEAFSPIGDDLRDTLLLAFTAAFVTMLAALVPAWASARSMSKHGGALDHGTFITSSLPGILVAFGIVQMMVLLKRQVEIDIGGDSLWLLLERFGVLVVLGYSMRYLAEGYAALKPAVLRLDPRQEESARSLGAGSVRRFFRVTLPALGPGMAAAYVLLFLAIVKELPIAMMLIPTGHTTLAYRIFDAQNEGLLPEVGLTGLVLLVMALGVQMVLLRWRRHV